MSNIIDDFDKDINLDDKIEESKETLKIYDSFDDISFLAENLNLLKGIFEYGFRTPSKIQNLTLDKIHSGIDIIAQSQSGTGKTGAFCIGALSRIDVNLIAPQVIILANTRELATQIHLVITELAKHMNINISLCIGGGKTLSDNNKTRTYNSENNRIKTSYSKDNSLNKSHVLVGTPGKMDELLRRKFINPRQIKLIILDEADILLNDNFVLQIKAIFETLSVNAQVCIFSATYQENILKLANIVMRTPEMILLKQEELSLELIKQYYIDVDQEKFKYLTLQDLYKQLRIGQCIIFVNSKYTVDKLVTWLIEDGHDTVGKIHGGMDSLTRINTLNDFRKGKMRVLVSTDVLSRGIDIQQIGIVINYDLPMDRSQYLHRIGRSGRYGKIGIAINLVSKRDISLIKDLEYFYKVNITEMPEFDFVNNQLLGLL